MLKRVILSILVIAILIFFTHVMLEVINSGKPIQKVLYKDLQVTFKEELACVKESFYINKSNYMQNLRIKLQEKNLKSDTIKVLVDDMEITKIGKAQQGELNYRKEKENDIIIGNIEDNILAGNHKIVIEYYIDLSTIITVYNNTSIMNLKYNDFTICKSVRLKLPEATKEFRISDNKVSFNKIKDDEYIINTEEMSKDIKIGIDRDSIPCNNVVKEEYTEFEKEEERLIRNKNAIKVFLSVISIITLINTIVTYIFTKLKKGDKEYYRDTEDIIDVVHAESLIDKKVNSSKLIMSVIVDQISEGNIIMENDILRLNKYDDKSEVKREIINMFFGEKDLINISDLSKVFRDNQKIDEIVEKFKKIRKQIVKEFYDLEIYDKSKEKLLKNIKKASIGIIWATITYVLYILYGFKFTLISTILTSLIGVPSVLIIKKSQFIRKTPLFAIPIIYFAVIIIGSVAINIKPIAAFSIKLIDIVTIAIISIINCITIWRSKKHVFTKKGKSEYKKLKGLNDYILDYSLIKERDIESTIIWDKYLVYATAFGIPSKVTERFSESLMNIIEILDKINKLLISEE